MARGIREFVIGTGGASLRGLDTLLAHSEIFEADTHGIMELQLYADRYEWRFVPAGGSFADSGSQVCH